MRKPLDLQKHPYSYETARDGGLFRGYVRHVVDGDTFDVFLDLGMGKYAYETIRLHRVDTPEINSGDQEERARGRVAAAFTRGLILDQPVLVRTFRDAETFGRYVADVSYYSLVSDRWEDLGSTLRALGHTK